MFNRWNIEVKHGLRVRYGYGRNGDVPCTGIVQRVDCRSSFARAYGAQVELADGSTVGADEISHSEPALPLRWQDVNPRDYQNPTALLVDFGHADGAPRWCIVGTTYGFLHTTSGDIRTWRSYSGARRAARSYQP